MVTGQQIGLQLQLMI